MLHTVPPHLRAGIKTQECTPSRQATPGLVYEHTITLTHTIIVSFYKEDNKYWSEKKNGAEEDVSRTQTVVEIEELCEKDGG